MSAAVLAFAMPPLLSAQDVAASSQDHYLKAPQTSLFARFADDVALGDGRLVVGEVGGGSSGTVYVYVKTSSGGWMLDAELKPACGDLADGFGSSVAISGDTVVVGAVWEDAGAVGINGDQKDNSATNAGAAYVFVRTGSRWVEQAYLKASNADAVDEFGRTVSIHGDVILVGAPLEDGGGKGLGADPADNSASNAGAAYVFARSGTVWAQVTYLKPSNTDAADFFGTSVALHGGLALVGSPCEDGGFSGVNPVDTDNSSSCAGAAYIFEDQGAFWAQSTYLKASNADGADRFGSAVALSDGLAVVGAPVEKSNAVGVDGDQSNNDLSTAGAAYVFRLSGSSWMQTAYLKATNTGERDEFGAHVSLDGTTVVVGAPGEASSSPGLNSDGSLDDMMEAGAVYVYRLFGGSWIPIAYVKATNPDFMDRFGAAVAVDDLCIVVGAPQESSADTGLDGNQFDNSLTYAGAAYLLSGFSGPLGYCVKSAPLFPCLSKIVVSDPKVGPVSGAGGYVVGADSVQGNQDGLLFGGMTGPSNIPFFGGGVLCVQPPLKRGPVMRSGGLSTTCSGSYSTVVNDGVTFGSGLDPGPGNSAWYQHWFRAVAPNGQTGFGLTAAIQLDFR